MYKSVVYTRGSESRGQAPGKPARATRGRPILHFHTHCVQYLSFQTKVNKSQENKDRMMLTQYNAYTNYEN